MNIDKLCYEIILSLAFIGVTLMTIVYSFYEKKYPSKSLFELLNFKTLNDRFFWILLISVFVLILKVINLPIISFCSGFASFYYVRNFDSCIMYVSTVVLLFTFFRLLYKLKTLYWYEDASKFLIKKYKSKKDEKFLFGLFDLLIILIKKENNKNLINEIVIEIDVIFEKDIEEISKLFYDKFYDIAVELVMHDQSYYTLENRIIGGMKWFPETTNGQICDESYQYFRNTAKLIVENRNKRLFNLFLEKMYFFANNHLKDDEKEKFWIFFSWLGGFLYYSDCKEVLLILLKFSFPSPKKLLFLPNSLSVFYEMFLYKWEKAEHRFTDYGDGSKYNEFEFYIKKYLCISFVFVSLETVGIHNFSFDGTDKEKKYLLNVVSIWIKEISPYITELFGDINERFKYCKNLDEFIKNLIKLIKDSK